MSPGKLASGQHSFGRGNAHFVEGVLAASADVGPSAVGGDVGHEVPAAAAFVAVGWVAGYGDAFGVSDLDLGDVEELLEACRMAPDGLGGGGGELEADLGFECLAD